MAGTPRKSQQAPFSATQAMKQLETRLSKGLTSRGKTKKMIDDAEQATNELSSTKRVKYIKFLHEVRTTCGPECATLCAIGLGQTKIAHMSRANLSALLSLLQKLDTTVYLNTGLSDIVPHAWKVSKIPARPTDRSLSGYFSFSFIPPPNMQTLEDFLSIRVLQHLNDGPIRALEQHKLLQGTEAIAMRLPRIAAEDLLLIIEIGSAQEIAAELFPERVYSACCKLEASFAWSVCH